MIFVTGDCHGDFQRFSQKRFPRQSQMGRGDYMIVAGDLGDVWAKGLADSNRLDRLEARPFITLFVIRNHENFELLNAYPEWTWHGGKIHQLRPHVLHIARGSCSRSMDLPGSPWAEQSPIILRTHS